MSEEAVVTVEPTPWTNPPAPWRWSCNWPLSDVWHTSVEDQGFTQTEAEAKALADLHVEQYHSVPIEFCGKPLPGRLSMTCNAPKGHGPVRGDHIRTVKGGRFYYGIPAEQIGEKE